MSIVLTCIVYVFFVPFFIANGGDCDFENNTFCEWENDNIGRAAFKWIIWSGRAPSDMTGPQTSDASGNRKENKIMNSL